MNTQISKTISLIKRSYDQPLILHRLYNYLRKLVSEMKIDYHPKDDWEKILILSVTRDISSNQSIELKLQKLIKSIKKHEIIECNSQLDKMRLLVICYYLNNRPVEIINHIIVFDLVSNFLGINDYFDGMIISIVRRICLWNIFGYTKNKKVTEDAITRMLEIISCANLSYENKIIVLPCFVISSIKPSIPEFRGVGDDLTTYKYFESILFYIKYTKTSTFLNDIVQEHPDFIQGVEAMLNNVYDIAEVENTDDSRQLVLENQTMFSVIANEYRNSPNKVRFIEKLRKFIDSLNE